MNGTLAAWVPPEVLVTALTFAVGLLYKLVLDRAKKTEVKLDELAKAITELDKRFVSSASLEQLSRMGDRFDARVTGLAQDVAVMKAVADRKP